MISKLYQKTDNFQNFLVPGDKQSSQSKTKIIPNSCIITYLHCVECVRHFVLFFFLSFKWKFVVKYLKIIFRHFAATSKFPKNKSASIHVDSQESVPRKVDGTFQYFWSHVSNCTNLKKICVVKITYKSRIMTK